MTNAKDEFIRFTANKPPIKCADISTENYFFDKFEALLPCGHTKQELDEFLNKLDFDYDCGYGGQELFGTVWFEDGSWADRGEYDGSEWWEHRTIPAIPTKLQKGQSDGTN